jgi:hypothetical protein
LAASSDASSHASCQPSPHPREGSTFSGYFKKSEAPVAKVFEEQGHASEAVARVWLATVIAIAIIRCNSEVESNMDHSTITITAAASLVEVAET